jgi:hypothetical protein
MYKKVENASQAETSEFASGVIWVNPYEVGSSR